MPPGPSSRLCGARPRIELSSLVNADFHEEMFSGVLMYDNKFVNISNNERQASNTLVVVWLRPFRALELEAVTGTAKAPRQL